jgi:energy-coupling factor transport system permease protein
MLYQNTNSMFHYLNGFTKIIIFVLMAPILLFCTQSLLVKMGLFLLISALLLLTKPSKLQLVFIYPAFIVSLFMSVTAFFGATKANEDVLFYVNLKIIEFSITPIHLVEALHTFLQLLGTSFAFFILLFTTTTKDLVAGMRKARVPEVLVLIFSITLRFWGVMVDDIKKIIDAQYCRGVDFKDKHWGKRIRNFLSILSPLIYILIKRSQITGLALTLKGFGSGKKKAIYYSPALSAIDKRSIVAALVVSSVVIVYSVQL